MSASAGKVMPRPRGEYNAIAEYTILDIVTYNDRPYMAKQTTTGNLPTNTTYWMLLLDFPTEVDNVPTQNSQNLVKSGGVYDATADKMAKDGTNSPGIMIGTNSYASLMTVDSIVKEAGDNQNVVMTETVSSSSNLPLEAIAARFTAFIGAEVYYSDSGNVYVIIDSVTTSGSDVVVTGHLKVDDSAAISLTSKSIYVSNYNTGDHNLIAGSTSAITGNNSVIAGKKSSITSDYPSAVVGEDNVCSSRQGLIAGLHNFASGLCSVVFGERNKSTHDNQLIAGYHNNNKSGTLFEIGNGSLTGSASNAFEVYSNGAISQDDGTNLFTFTKSSGKAGYYDGSNVFHPFEEPLYLTEQVTLSTSANTLVTFTNAAILETSMIEIFTDEFGTNPIDVAVASGGGACTVTFKKVTTAHTINCRIKVVNP